MPSVEGADDNVPPRGFGVYGRSNKGGYGVFGESNSSIGVTGYSPDSVGVYGVSSNFYGVYGVSTTNVGVYASSSHSTGLYGTSYNGDGVRGDSYNGDGVRGDSRYSAGVFGRSIGGTGVYGECSYGAGVYGDSPIGPGVHGRTYDGYGVRGDSRSRYGAGVFGRSIYGVGVYGDSHYDTGVLGSSNHGDGVFGRSSNGVGVYGLGISSVGVYGSSLNINSFAAFLDGNVNITGTLQKGGGRFKIDHPLDPANKYLSHSFVESPDMKNVYDGVVTLDDIGEAEIELPDWFGALNKDFRYQLTAIGAPGPNLYIAEEISDDAATSNYNNNKSRFKIAGGTSGMKVSWQVTGIRKDPWANAHRISVEEDKPAKERGYYMYPELYGQPEEKGISHLLFSRDEKEEEKENVMVVT